MLYWSNIVHEIERMLMLGFRESQSFLHILSRNYQFMYTEGDLLKHKKMAVRGVFSPFSGPNCKIVNSVGQGNFKFVRGNSKNFRNFWLWQPC